MYFNGVDVLGAAREAQVLAGGGGGSGIIVHPSVEWECSSKEFDATADDPSGKSISTNEARVVKYLGVGV